MTVEVLLVSIHHSTITTHWHSQRHTLQAICQCHPAEAEERLAPILMTALTTALALAPLLVTGNKPGQEIEYPMAFVILGGLITSTLLNLHVLPPLFAKFGHRSLPQADRADSQIHL